MWWVITRLKSNTRFNKRRILQWNINENCWSVMCHWSQIWHFDGFVNDDHWIERDSCCVVSCVMWSSIGRWIYNVNMINNEIIVWNIQMNIFICDWILINSANWGLFDQFQWMLVERFSLDDIHQSNLRFNGEETQIIE